MVCVWVCLSPSSLSICWPRRSLLRLAPLSDILTTTASMFRVMALSLHSRKIFIYLLFIQVIFNLSTLQLSSRWYRSEPFPHPLLLPHAVLHQVVRGCPGSCSCPTTPPSCPVGVSLVLDECGCCKVCAQQFNQECSPDKPCDHIKGLRCHLGAGGDPQRGLCRGERTMNMFTTRWVTATLFHWTNLRTPASKFL